MILLSLPKVSRLTNGPDFCFNLLTKATLMTIYFIKLSWFDYQMD